MSENNAGIQSAEQIQSAEAPKKRVRIGFVFLSIVPVAVLIGRGFRKTFDDFQ